MVTTAYRSGPYLSSLYLRASLTAHSLASAPELHRNTRPMPVARHTSWANSD